MPQGSEETTTTTQRKPEQVTPEARRAAKGAWLGLFVDYFDIYLPIVAMAPAIIYFAPPALSGATQATFTYAIFAASFLGRPIGTFIFGHIGDAFGRRKATLISAAGVAVSVFVTGLLPVYAIVGAWATVLLVFARLVGGIFMGVNTPARTRSLWNAHPNAFEDKSVAWSREPIPSHT